MGGIMPPPSNYPQPRHAWLYALPQARLPTTVCCNGTTYELVETFKHDFFAGTGLYRGPNGLAVLKINRVNRFFGLSLDWLGRFLARREMRFYRLLADTVGIPRLIGAVGDTGLLHAYVPGQPLERRQVVSDTFFDELAALLEVLHTRHIAYVDLNKRQNILVGEDGRPYLIDFQISLWLPPTGWRGWVPLRWLLRRFQEGDYYHYLKHKRRLRPDLLSAEERAVAERVGVWIRLHRLIARPLTHLRRRFLRRLHGGTTAEVAGASGK